MHYYTRDVIKGKWPEAEEVIRSHIEYGSLYNMNNLSKTFRLEYPC
jgi:hypothetical protein